MTYTEEKKQEVLRLLATEAGNNTTRCAQLTGISKSTILNWKKTQEKTPNPSSPSAENATTSPCFTPFTTTPQPTSQPVPQPIATPANTPTPIPEPTPPLAPQPSEEEPLPTPSELKRRIIRRVSQLIDTCTDLKKLMDTHEALSKSERDSAPPAQETLFDLLSRQLSPQK